MAESEHYITRKDLFPEKLLAAARFIYPSVTFSAIMLEISAMQTLRSEQRFMDDWLSCEEKNRLTTFKLPKRQNEWFAGRLCAKVAAGKLNNSNLSTGYAQFRVVNNSEGRPLLLQPTHSRTKDFDLSISHSGNLAAALLASSYCGIDIQQARQTLLRVKERFCSPAEEKQLNSYFNATIGPGELNLLWAAKEAIRKALSYRKIPEFLALELCEAVNSQHHCHVFGFLYQGKEITTVCCTYKDYAMALCMHKGILDA